MNMEAIKHRIVSAHDGIRKLKETVGNNNRRAKGFHAITWLVEELDKLKDTKFAVQCGIVYGAFARGSKTYQQMDFLLILEENTDEELAMNFFIDNIISKIYMEVKILPYLDIINPKTLRLSLDHPTPLIQRIQAEGIVFYGVNVLEQEAENVQNAHSTV
jgi:hypothetical protein